MKFDRKKTRKYKFYCDSTNTNTRTYVRTHYGKLKKTHAHEHTTRRIKGVEVGVGVRPVGDGILQHGPHRVAPAASSRSAALPLAHSDVSCVNERQQRILKKLAAVNGQAFLLLVSLCSQLFTHIKQILNFTKKFISFKLNFQIKIGFHHSVACDDIFKTRSHMNMF